MGKLKKIFNGATRISMSLTLTATILSIIGILITGFYPGIIVFISLVLIPFVSRFYAKSNDSHTSAFYITLSILNFLEILVVIWMTFVIMIDRVFPKI